MPKKTTHAPQASNDDVPPVSSPEEALALLSVTSPSDYRAFGVLLQDVQKAVWTPLTRDERIKALEAFDARFPKRTAGDDPTIRVTGDWKFRGAKKGASR